MNRVAIVGGGLAGLALGHALSTREAGPDVMVFESQPRAGGVVRTERADGFLFEHGPSGFLDNAPDTLALAHDLGLADRLIASDDRARRRFVYRNGRLREVPLSPAALFTSGVLSGLGLLRVAAEPLVRRRAEGDESIHSFASRRLGAEAADVLADSIASGVFGGDARQLSLRACFPSVPAMEARHGSLLKAMLSSRRERRGPPPRRGRLSTFRDGLGELTSALARSLDTRLHISQGVQRIRMAAGSAGYVLMLADGRAVSADAVVLAGGADASARLLFDFDNSLASVLAEIPAAPIVTVGLGYEIAAIGRRLDGFGFLAPRQSGLRLLGVLWESSVFADRAPAGHALLRVMIGGATDADAVDLDDERLLARVRAELRTTMQVNGAPSFARVVRHRVGIPQYVIGHTERMARIDAALARHPGLFVGGHAFRGVGVNACIADARPLADRVIASLAGRAAA